MFPCWQGGVVPAVIYVGHQSKLTRECDITPGRYAICSTTQRSSLAGTPGTGPPFITNVIFYKTYMPPRHLLAYPKKLRGMPCGWLTISYLLCDWFVINIDLSDVIINVTDLAGTSIQNASTLIQSQMHIPASLVPADTMSKMIFSYNASNTAYERYPFPTARSSATASRCTTQQVPLTAISPEQNASHHARHGNSTSWKQVLAQNCAVQTTHQFRRLGQDYPASFTWEHKLERIPTSNTLDIACRIPVTPPCNTSINADSVQIDKENPYHIWIL